MDTVSDDLCGEWEKPLEVQERVTVSVSCVPGHRVLLNIIIYWNVSQSENSSLLALVEIEIKVDRVYSVLQCYHNVHQTFFVISGTWVSPSVLGGGRARHEYSAENKEPNIILHFIAFLALYGSYFTALCRVCSATTRTENKVFERCVDIRYFISSTLES